MISTDSICFWSLLFNLYLLTSSHFLLFPISFYPQLDASKLIVFKDPTHMEKTPSNIVLFVRYQAASACRQ